MPVHRWHGRLLPLLDLAAQLGATSDGRAAGTVVVLRCDAGEFGLLVDEVLETQEIVVKPLGPGLGAVRLFSGAAVMGDGRIALILDVPGLAAAGRVAAGTASGALTSPAGLDGLRVTGALPVRAPRMQRLLLARTAGDQRVVLPLEQVWRLEDVDPTRLEHVAGGTAMHYRGDLLPVVELDRALGGVPTQAAAPALERLSDAAHVTVGLVLAGRAYREAGRVSTGAGALPGPVPLRVDVDALGT